MRHHIQGKSSLQTGHLERINQHRQSQRHRGATPTRVENRNLAAPALIAKPLSAQNASQRLVTGLLIASVFGTLVPTAHAAPARSDLAPRDSQCPMPVYARALKGEANAKTHTYYVIADHSMFAQFRTNPLPVGVPGNVRVAGLTPPQVMHTYLGKAMEAVKPLIPAGHDLTFNLFKSSQFNLHRHADMGDLHNVANLQRIGDLLKMTTNECTNSGHPMARPSKTLLLVPASTGTKIASTLAFGGNYGRSMAPTGMDDGGVAYATYDIYRDTPNHEFLHSLGATHLENDAVAEDGKPAIMRRNPGYRDEPGSVSRKTKVKIAGTLERWMS